MFGELQQDLLLATSVFQTLVPNRISTVSSIEFEYSPGRGDPKFTGDRSAFDVFVTYKTIDNKPGFIGIEVKYHENLKGEKAPHRQRYEEISHMMGCFTKEAHIQLQKQPLQQIWRDHLLAGSYLYNSNQEDGFFVFLYPKDNRYCSEAISDYQSFLTDQKTISAWTLEEIYIAIKKQTQDKWIDELYNRYLNFTKIDNYNDNQ